MPMRNQSLEFRPMRFAKDAVINGILNSANNPSEIKNAAPMISMLYIKVTK